MKRVVVTGLGAITPVGNNIATFWENLVAGNSGVTLIDRFDTTHYKTKFAFQVKNFDPSEVIPKADARKMDLITQYALCATDECLKDTGFNPETFNLNKMGVIWGTGVGGIGTVIEGLREHFEGGSIPRFGPFFITKMIPNITAGQISMRYGLKGVSHTINSACASSNDAIAEAYNLIKLGKAQVIVAGGSEAAICEGAIGGFNASRALSVRNETYQTASSPFDKNRDGFVMGEGAAALVLEELDHARARGAKIYCEIVGASQCSDAYHLTAPHPEGEGAYRAMSEALDEAGLLPEDVDYINAHATATPIGDPSECKAIGNLFGSSLDKLNIGATKSIIGHLLGGAGAIEAVICILAIQNNTIPPTINLKELDPEISPKLNLTRDVAVKKQVDVAMNNTFGFGSHVSVTLFKRLT